MGHTAHFYGPFSEDVEDDVEGLLLAGLIDERATSLGFQGYGGDAAKRYEYSVTEEKGSSESKRFARHIRKNLGIFRSSLSNSRGPPADSTRACCRQQRRPTTSLLGRSDP